MRRFILTLLFVILSATGCMLRAVAAEQAVPRYGKFEASFTIPNQTGNPFDPAVNDVDVAFTGPDGQVITTPAFWDGTTWRVRFCPAHTGHYTLAIAWNGQPVTPPDLSASGFDCVKSDDPGFVRRDPTTVQRFLFDNGTPYYPLGVDEAWTNGGAPGYESDFSHMRDSGMNWTRVWMNYWDDKNLEWGPAAFGQPSTNPAIGSYQMGAARQWDQIMDWAAQNGVYVQMTLQHHGEYTAQVDPNWADNPFNVANGGFLKNPDDFFTDPRAITLTKNKYRYIVARWGYSTHLLSFELFNEVQNIREAQGHFQDVVNWHKTMMDYIRSIDPYHHLITTSTSVPGEPLSKIGLDYLQPHFYVPDLASALGALPLATLDTPLFVGEWGPGGGTQMNADVLHHGEWAGILTPMAGAAEYWFWDDVERNNYWPLFASLSGFLNTYHVTDNNDTNYIQALADAPGPRADITFAPPLGWAPTTTTDVTVAPTGAVTGIAGMSSYLNGSANRAMLPAPVVFHLSPTAPCQFIISIGQSGRNGAHPQLILDGTVAVEKDYPAAGRDTRVNEKLAVDVPAGEHTVGLYNTGADWATITAITVTGYGPPLAALARGNSRSAAFWVYARAGQQASVDNGSVTLSGLSHGRYKVKLWDTTKGQPIPGGSASYANGSVIVQLPTIQGDIAGVVTK